MNSNEYIAKILKQEGVEWLACFPMNPLIEAAAKEGIRPILFRHERGVLMAADGFSRTGTRQTFGVAAVQAQAGAENSFGGLAQSFADNIPVLVFPGGVRLDQVFVRPNFSAVQNYGGLAKHVEAIYRPDQVGNVMRRAFHALRSGSLGPVVVELPEDVCEVELPDSALNYRSPKPVRQTPSAGDIKDAVKALLAAKKPVIWAGGGVLLGGATAELKELAELTGIPVFCTMRGKSAFDERHPLALGAGAEPTTLPAHQWLAECDVLLALGSSLTLTEYGQPIRPGKVLIQNTNNIDEINKDHMIDIGLAGDARLTIQALIDEIKAQVGEGYRGEGERNAVEIAKNKQKWLADWKNRLTSDEEPLNTYRVINDINRTLDLENSIVTHDSGSSRDSMVPFFNATAPHSYVGWGKSTHLGFGLPMLMGAKLAHPEKFCLNMMGDAAFGMSGLDIETSVRERIPITTVLLNNGAMTSYPTWYPAAHARYYFSKLSGDYAKIAEGMGAVGITVAKVAEFVPALKRAQQLNADGRTVLIDVHANTESKRSRF